MPQEPYAGSCNPSRRAKQTRADDALAKKTIAAPSNPPRNILPLPSQNADDLYNDNASVVTPQPGPAKRGRKPGPLSRSAREAQRKLNHSIIEKARRTKINDALTTLRQLVPADYGYTKSRTDDETEEGSDTEEDVRKKEKTKKPGKREEKEKEFKLEILVRTVSFMQDLLARVQLLESGSEGCSNCAQKAPSKRRHDQIDGEANQNREGFAKRPRMEESGGDIEPTKDAHKDQPSPSSQVTPRPYLGSRLPSISSWLPNSHIDPLLLPHSQRHSPENVSQLPSPPSSTHFDPIHPSHVPPVLSLGPVASLSLLSSRRTPEDESAASLLLQISANSPQLLPIASSAPCTSFDMSTMRTSCVTPVDRATVPVPQAHTPGSMLGLVRRK
ncbi:hypothetical protein FPV67DRAFT_1419423 [Lyophyllum atratum]|nr:hypothetical protein FPV67DRAFT_1419423 [Lyophyllum atratum]